MDHIVYLDAKADELSRILIGKKQCSFGELLEENCLIGG